jgi:pimeloyl-ACP methyl ester carboxylesterase
MPSGHGSRVLSPPGPPPRRGRGLRPTGATRKPAEARLRPTVAVPFRLMPTERRIQAGSLSLSIREHEGGKPPVIALHGLASNARWWDLVAPRLEEQVVAVDLRGHGLSDKPDTGYDFIAVAGDVLDVVGALGIDEYVVAGHSWGASVALWVAVLDARRCRGCVCVDGGATDLRAYFGNSWSEAQIAMRPPQLQGATEATIRSWMAASPLAEGSDPATAFEIMLGNFEPAEGGTIRPRLRIERHMQIAEHLFEQDPHELMRQVAVPVLIIPAGDPADPPTPKREAVESALEVLGDRGSVVWIDGVHDIPVQRPVEVAAAIEAWIRSRALQRR